MLELFIKYVGFGARCSNCGAVRETTRYSIRRGDDELQSFKLCDRCQDKGFTIKFNPKSKDAMWAADRRRRIKKSRKLEQDLAADMKGKVQPGSGNQDDKADVRVVDEWRMEHKYTESVKGYRLLVSDLARVIQHGNMAGEWPALVLNFVKLKRRFAILPYEVFLEIVEKVRGKTTDNR